MGAGDKFDGQPDPGGRQTLDGEEAERQRAGEAGHHAADRLAVDVADPPDAETLPAEQRSADLGERVGDDVGAPDQREDGGELVARVDAGQLAPIGTSTNLKQVHSVVMSRQLARASTPSMIRDCGP